MAESAVACAGRWYNVVACPHAGLDTVLDTVADLEGRWRTELGTTAGPETDNAED